MRPEPPGETALDAPGDVPRGFGRALGPEQPAGDLVDGADILDGEMPVDLLADLVMEIDVDVVPRLDDDELRTQPPRLIDLGARADAVRLGLVAGGDGAGALAHHRRHGDGAPAQARLRALFDAGEVAVEIEEQPVEAVTHWHGPHPRKRVVAISPSTAAEAP
jgi:hypothetical protein